MEASRWAGIELEWFILAGRGDGRRVIVRVVLDVGVQVEMRRPGARSEEDGTGEGSHVF